MSRQKGFQNEIHFVAQVQKPIERVLSAINDGNLKVVLLGGLLKCRVFTVVIMQAD